MSWILRLKSHLAHILNKGSARSVRVRKHTLASLFVKGASLLATLVLVPVSLAYVGEKQYGIWLTLISIVGWLRFFDIGLGNSLKNKFAEALAKDNAILARAYVSTAYAGICGISLIILGLFWSLNYFLDWSRILNAPADLAADLKGIASLMFSFFCLNFLLKLVGSILTGDQKPAWLGSINLLTNVLMALGVVALSHFTRPSLWGLAWNFSLVPALVFAATSLYLFSKTYRIYRPQMEAIKKERFRELFSLSVPFFFVQLTGMVIFATDNLIITQLLGPEEVPAYNIAFKYFGVPQKIFGIISFPLWSAFTEAYYKGDIDWIRLKNKELIKIWAILGVLSLLMLLFSPYLYALWVPEIEIPFRLSLMMCLYGNLLSWGGIFVMFINGVGKIRLQGWVSAVGALINIPLSIYFTSYMGWGSSGVIFASMISLAFGPVLGPIQYRKIIHNRAKGIWNI